MKRSVTLLLILMLCTLLPAFSQEYEDLYDMVVPTQYDSLSLRGSLGSSDALRFNVPFDGSAVQFRLGTTAGYRYIHQQLESTLSITANTSFELGTASNEINIWTPTLYYKSYSLDLAGNPGFIFASGSGAEISISNTGSVDVPIFAGIGVGRLYSITDIHIASLKLRHLGLSTDPQTVRNTTEQMRLKTEKTNPMVENTAELYNQYYRELAAIMGASGREIEVVHIDHSQRYAFERRRYESLNYGWEIYAGLKVHPDYSYGSGLSNFDINVGPEIGGRYAAFLLDHMLHYEVKGDVSFGYEKFGWSTSGGLYVLLSADGRVRYLPEDVRWWIDGEADLTIGYDDGFTFGLNAAGIGYYMFDPNFTVHAGAGIGTNNGLEIHAGGTIRFW